MAAALVPASKKRPIADPVAARVALIDGQFDLPAENLQAMRDVRAAVAECAKKIQQAVEKKAKKNDKGRLIHAMDLLQQAKDTACVSCILPYAEEEQVVPSADV